MAAFEAAVNKLVLEMVTKNQKVVNYFLLAALEKMLIRTV